MSRGEVWRRLPGPALESLAHALEAGRVGLPPLPSALERYVGRELADDAVMELAALQAEAFSGSQIARLLRTVALDEPAHGRIELVWSGPEGVQASSRDTGVVVPELFASAKRSVVVAGYAIHRGDRVFARLAANMDDNPALDVRIFTNIKRPRRDVRSDSELVREFAEKFRRTHWSGRRLPRVLYDTRALSLSRGPQSCLHAKCMIVDDARALVTSANFTEAAMDRNIEAGVMIEDVVFASRLRAQFDALERSEHIKSVSGLQA